MREWFARQYEDVRGNFKWGLLMLLWWALTTYGKKGLSSIPSVPQWAVNVGLFMLALIGFIWIATLIARSPRAAKENALTNGTAEQDTFAAREIERLKKEANQTPNWCAELVKEDAKRTQERIVAPIWVPLRHFDLREPNPYVDFRVTFINATVFNVEADKIEGQSYYERSPLPHLLSVAPESDKFSLVHGDVKQIMLRQHVSRETAEAMENARGVVRLDLSRVRIKFKVLNSDIQGAPTQFDWHPEDAMVAIPN